MAPAGTVTDACVDAFTKYQRTPSSAMNAQWFHGTGVLDKPMQLLPCTNRADYSLPRIEDLPSQWLSSTARTLLGLKIPAVIVMRAVVEDMVTEVEKNVLDEIEKKHHTFNKALTIVQFILRCRTQFKTFQLVEQR